MPTVHYKIALLSTCVHLVSTSTDSMCQNCLACNCIVLKHTAMSKQANSSKTDVPLLLSTLLEGLVSSVLTLNDAHACACHPASFWIETRSSGRLELIQANALRLDSIQFNVSDLKFSISYTCQCLESPFQ